MLLHRLFLLFKRCVRGRNFFNPFVSPQWIIPIVQEVDRNVLVREKERERERARERERDRERERERERNSNQTDFRKVKELDRKVNAREAD